MPAGRWWGEPWTSGICYEQGGALRVVARVAVPLGCHCGICLEPIVAGDRGVSMPAMTAEGPKVAHIHRECNLRSVLGGIRHLRGECSHIGDCMENRPEGMTARQDALAVWEFMQRRAAARYN